MNGPAYGTGCSGIGGMDLGLDRAGWQCAFQIEYADYQTRILEKHWPAVTRFRDVYDVTGNELPWVDLYGFGFPCLGLSQSSKGSHKGLEDTASRVFYPCARIAREMRPTWLLMENVRGVKKYKQEIEAELPYWELEYADLTASDFGLPNRRVRTFIVGHPRGRSTRPVLDRAALPGAAVQARRPGDIFPMCLPWKGGLSLERLGSCVITDAPAPADTTGIRTGDRAAGRLDKARYLAVGNAVCPPIAEWIGRRIMEQI